jgi:hypothetical protein
VPAAGADVPPATRVAGTVVGYDGGRVWFRADAASVAGELSCVLFAISAAGTATYVLKFI